MFTNEQENEYLSKTKKSNELFARSKSLFPGGVSHNIRNFPPYPFFTLKAKKAYLYDVDNNRYTDYWMGHWALILGHSPSFIQPYLIEQIKNGTLFGTVNSISVDLAEIIKKTMPQAQKLRFCSTGSEATMYAIRLARAFTSKKIVAKIIGGWHGFNSTLLQSVNYPFELDEGRGLVEEQFIESIPFNDLERSLKILESIKDDLACIIVEPILAGAGCILPQDDYLKGLQEFAQKNNALFILDEIVTGFRVSLNGAMSNYKIDPDIFTLGKIAGGGFPIGIVCGKDEILDIADTSRNDKQTVCEIGGGTFSANPMTMTAGYYTIQYLRQNTQVYENLGNLGQYLRTELSKTFSDFGVEVEITGTESLFMIHFLNDRVKQIRSAVDVALSNKEKLRRYNFFLLSNFNIFFLPLKMGAISLAHTKENINELITATEKILQSGILK